MKIITEANVSELFDGKSKYIGLDGVSVSNMVINPDMLNGVDYIEHCRFDNVTFENIKTNNIICENIDFNMVTFKNCVLIDTKFENCSLDGISFSSCTFIRSSFENCIFSQASYSSIRYSYIGFSKTHPNDKIPEAFLNHCHLPPITLEMENCQMNTIGAGSNVSLVSNEEDLKSIVLKNIIRVGEMNPEILTVGPIGSRHDYTTYIPCIDWVQCGCWVDNELSKDIGSGGSLQAFEARVKEKYGNNGRRSNRSIYFEEYMNAINIFKLARKKYLDKTIKSIQK